MLITWRKEENILFHPNEHPGSAIPPTFPGNTCVLYPKLLLQVKTLLLALSAVSFFCLWIHKKKNIANQGGSWSWPILAGMYHSVALRLHETRDRVRSIYKKFYFLNPRGNKVCLDLRRHRNFVVLQYIGKHLLVFPLHFVYAYMFS